METNDVIASALAQVDALKGIVEDKYLSDPYEYRETMLDWLAMYGWETFENTSTYKEEEFEFIINFDCRNSMFSMNILDTNLHKMKNVKYHMQLI